VKDFILQLRWAIAGALVLAIAGVVVALTFHFDQRRAAAEFALARAASASAAIRLEAAHLERREVIEYLPRYRALEALGAFGDERRLAWIERLDALRGELKSPRLEYTIAARAPLPDRAEPVPGLSFEASRLKVEFDLLHEGDLFVALKRLTHAPMGVSEIQSCTLRRLPRTAAATPRGDAPPDGSPNLGGECQLDWISLIAAKPADPSATGAPEAAATPAAAAPAAKAGS
jgi:hypothetical protein